MGQDSKEEKEVIREHVLGRRVLGRGNHHVGLAKEVTGGFGKWQRASWPEERA